MSVDNIIKILSDHDNVVESYVLLREIPTFLEFKNSDFRPEIKIKVWKCSINNKYYFSVSHHVKTPSQMSPYHPSRKSASTEIEAIEAALTSTKAYIESAISKGQEPEDSWLVKNETF